MNLKISLAAVVVLSLGACGNYVAYRTSGHQVMLSEFDKDTSSQADRTVQLVQAFDASKTRIGLAKIAGTTALCETLFATQSGSGISSLRVFNRLGSRKARYDNIQIAGEIVRLGVNTPYDTYDFINTGVGPNFFECIEVGPAKVDNKEVATDLIVYLRPRIGDHLGQALANVAIQVEGRTGNLDDIEFYTSQPNRLVIQPQDSGGASFARNPSTNALIINGQTARDENGNPIILLDGTVRNEPSSNIAYAY